MNALKLHKRDQRVRERIGWSSMAFITPTFPKPRTRAEKEARKVFSRHRDLGRTYMLHVYDVLEMIEDAYQEGRKAT